mgnify:FL=1
MPRRCASNTAWMLFLILSISTTPTGAVGFDPGQDPPYAAAILVEAQSGTVLFQHNAHEQRSPASTQKILLELVAMRLIESGQFSLGDSVRVSARAARTGGSQVFLAHGEVFSIEDLLEAVVIPSANDACVAIAEHMSGSVERFVEQMNAEARHLGLQNTHCVNVHGLDDTPMNNRNLTTAYDLSQIARALIHYPQVLAWSSIRYKPFRNGEFMLYTTNNRLLGKFDGLDGLKTGYTQRAKSCLVATAKRRDMRLISVILGARSEKLRDRETKRLINWGFETFSRVPLVDAGQLMGTVLLDWGLEPQVRVLIADEVAAILSPEQERALVRQLDLPDLVPAPVEQGTQLGRLKVSLGDSVLADVPVVAEKDVGRMDWWDKLMSYF